MFSGSIVALVTPMDQQGAIDYPSLKDLVDWHIESGTSAIVAVGTTGESATLTLSEHISVVEAVVTRVHGRIPVIAGNGSCATQKSVELTQQMKLAGADACLCVTPYYNRPTQEGLFQHYMAVANAADIPQILYNVPTRTGVDLQVSTVARLAVHPNIVALKEADPSKSKIRELIEVVGDKLDLLSGDDKSCREFMEMGGQGVISVTANVAPKLMAELCVYALTGNSAQALKIDHQLNALHHAMGVQSNPIPAKWALSAMGKITDSIRLPLVSLSPEYHQDLIQVLKQLKIA